MFIRSKELTEDAYKVILILSLALALWTTYRVNRVVDFDYYPKLHDFNVTEKIDETDRQRFLVYAIFHLNGGAIVRMLDHGVRLDYRGGRDGNTPLHVAAMTGDEGMFDLLVSCGADINALNNDGGTVVQAARQTHHSELAFYVEEKYKDRLKSATEEN